MPRLPRGAKLHRNLDFAFSKALSRETAVRTLAVNIVLTETDNGFSLCMKDESGCQATAQFDYPHEEARSPQRGSIVRQLSKLGDTVFTLHNVTIDTNGERFIPASVLAGWRREVCAQLETAHYENYERDHAGKMDDEKVCQFLPKELTFNANVANHLAETFYKEHGVEKIARAFELEQPKGETVIMTCRHCIRHALDICLKKTKGGPKKLSLQLPDGKRFPLKFDCKNCEMQVLKS